MLILPRASTCGLSRCRGGSSMSPSAPGSSARLREAGFRLATWLLKNSQNQGTMSCFMKTFKVVDDDGEEQWLGRERRIKAMHLTSQQVNIIIIITIFFIILILRISTPGCGGHDRPERSQRGRNPKEPSHQIQQPPHLCRIC